ncbi:winged helix-turn-helix transcriptional regulator [Deinococcus aluminii]|uniref:winged helix-turn-helix transcriptional regulator n=1 Tax=Deinococcus aluminii TaxID=1656885 RepID=UPI003CD0BCE7
MDDLPDLAQFKPRDYVTKLIFLWLSAVGPVRTNRELAEVLGVDETTVGQRLKALAESGLIERHSTVIRIRSERK